MKAYTVTVRYSVHENGTVTSTTIDFKRYAKDESSAISVVSALFGALSNYVDSLGNKYITVGIVSATEIT